MVEKYSDPYARQQGLVTGCCAESVCDVIAKQRMEGSGALDAEAETGILSAVEQQ
jgi:hypothetical protein